VPNEPSTNGRGRARSPRDPATNTNDAPSAKRSDVAPMVTAGNDTATVPRHETRPLPHGLVAVLVLHDPRVRAADAAADAALRAALNAGHTAVYAKDKAAAAREAVLNEAGVAS